MVNLRQSLVATALATIVCGGVASAALSQDLNGYEGVPRTMLWSTGPIEFTDTSQYKKDPPYVIGFSNASVNNTWRLAQLHSIQSAAARNADMIEHLYITDANDSPTKQVSDVQDLIERGVDILLVSAVTSDALDPVVTRAMEDGIPVVMVDRRITSDNFVSFVTASDMVTGRLYAQWLVEMLSGEGNIVMLPGQAGASPAELRIQAAYEIFNQYPGIKILDMQYTDWSAPKAKSIMSAMIQRFGDEIDGVWNDSGVQGVGALEAFVAAGYAPGTIPPATCADLNGCLRVAVENDISVLNFDYPAGMGGDALELALLVMQGVTVPKTYVVNADIVITKGDETASIRADRWVEDYVQMDKPNDLILSSGLGPDYDSNTFSVAYPE